MKAIRRFILVLLMCLTPALGFGLELPAALKLEPAVYALHSGAYETELDTVSINDPWIIAQLDGKGDWFSFRLSRTVMFDQENGEWDHKDRELWFAVQMDSTLALRLGRLLTNQALGIPHPFGEELVNSPLFSRHLRYQRNGSQLSWTGKMFSTSIGAYRADGSFEGEAAARFSFASVSGGVVLRDQVSLGYASTKFASLGFDAWVLDDGGSEKFLATQASNSWRDFVGTARAEWLKDEHDPDDRWLDLGLSWVRKPMKGVTGKIRTAVSWSDGDRPTFTAQTALQIKM